ncbi:Bicarbonate transport ATP-binding protein CmpD [subsurface metagenome]
MNKIKDKNVIIGVENVYKAYGDKKVLENVSFGIEKEKFTCVVGPSGCGKTILVYLIAGYEAPDKGRITINGEPIMRPGSDRLVVFQETELFYCMNLWDNTMFGPLAQNKDLEDSIKDTKWWIDRVGLEGFEDKFSLQLSGGMQRRAELIRGLINRPKVMLMDEPFRGLDALTKQFMQEYTNDLFEELHIPIFFITTEIEEAIFLSDTIIFFTPGPGKVAKIMNIDLPRPRKLEMIITAQFFEYKREAINILYSKEMMEEGGWEIVRKLGKEVIG